MKDETIENIGRTHHKVLGRDAIHVAVIQAVAREEMYSGANVRIAFDGRATCRAGAPFIGVVDPFLDRHSVINPGEKFYIFLYPQTITGLRHEWTHPILDAPPLVLTAAEQWLRQFADTWALNYDLLITEASNRGNKKYGNYITADGIDLHSYGDLGEDGPLFWHNLEILTGQKFEEGHRLNFGWSCTC